MEKISPTDFSLRSSLPVLAASLLASVLVYFRVQDVLPTIFGDELVYQQMSYFDDYGTYLGNGIYSALFSLTQGMGIEAYGVIKQINIVFLFFMGLAVGVYALRRLSLWLSGLIAFASVFSPVGVYASFFMPEVMFVAIMAWSLVLFDFYWHSQRLQTAYVFLSLSFLLLTVASLVKPHALFVVPIMLLFLLFDARTSMAVRLGIAALSTGAIAGVNIALTAIFAPGSLPLFGDYMSGVFSLLFGSEAVEVSTDVSEGAAANAESPDINLVSFVLGQLLGFFVIIFSAIGSAIALIWANARDKFHSKLSLSLLIWLVVVIIAFAYYVTARGDDHTDRILLRYIEWLFVFVIIDAGASLAKSEEVPAWKRNVVGTIAIVQAASAFVYPQLGFETLISDSIFGSGVALNADSPWLIALLSLTVAYFMLRIPEKAPVVVTGIFGATLIGLGLSAQQYQLDVNTTAVSSDKAGIYLYEQYKGEFDEPLLIVGSDRTLNQSTIFWSRIYQAELQTTDAGRAITVSESEIEQVVLTLDGITLNESQYVQQLYEGDGFYLYRVDQVIPE